MSLMPREWRWTGARLQRAPEERRIYSNAGIEVAGQMLEEATGSPISRWIEKMSEPLGLASLEVKVRRRIRAAQMRLT